jgi:hypothetical protein
MAELYLRQSTTTTPTTTTVKNSPLTNEEVDSNFVNLNTDVVDAQSAASAASESSVAMAIALGG